MTTSKNTSGSPFNAVADSASTTADTPIDINVLANDPVPPGLVQSLYSVSQSGTNVADVATTKLGATITTEPDGTIEYDPSKAPAIQSLAQGATATDTFVYEVRDATKSGAHSFTSTGTVTVHVTGSAPSTIPQTDATVDSVDVGQVLAAGSRTFNNGEVTETANGSGLDTFSGSSAVSSVNITDENTGDSYVLNHLNVGAVYLDEARTGPYSGAAQTATLNDVAQPSVTFGNGGLGNAQATINQSPSGTEAYITDYGQGDNSILNEGTQSSVIGQTFGNSDTITVSETYNNPLVPSAVYLTAFGQNDNLHFVGGNYGRFVIIRFYDGASGVGTISNAGGARFLLFAGSTTDLTGGSGGNTYSFLSNEAGTQSGGWHSTIENLSPTDAINLPGSMQAVASFTPGMAGTQPETTIAIGAGSGFAASTITVVGADLTAASSQVHWT